MLLLEKRRILQDTSVWSPTDSKVTFSISSNIDAKIVLSQLDFIQICYFNLEVSDFNENQKLSPVH